MISLYRYCPQENAAGVFCLDHRAQEAVIALGLYFLESGCQHETKIVPYLLRLNKALPKAVWQDDGKPKKTDRMRSFLFSSQKNKFHASYINNAFIVLNFSGIPAAERFSFCLNTLLSDISVSCPDVRDTIIQNQVDTLDTLTNMIKSSRDSSNTLPPINLCKATVPILLGLGRAMGRYAHTSPPLLCRIFPPTTIPTVHKVKTQSSMINQTPLHRQQSLSQFRSIIPRSLSGGLSCEALDDAMSDTTDSPSRRPPKLQSYYSVPYDPTTYFFSKYGSSFNQFQNMRFYETPEKKQRIHFKIQDLQSIFAIAKRLLTKETLEFLDEQASDIYSLHQIKSYGYKSFSETINLVLVTLLREVLHNQTGEGNRKRFDSISNLLKLQKKYSFICSFANAIHKGCARFCENFISKWANGITEQTK